MASSHFDVTPKDTTASKKFTITYTVSTHIQSRQTAINEIPPEQQITYPFRQRDPRLIVYEPARPEIDPLPPQEGNASSKEWITNQLVTAMMGNSNDGNEFETSFINANEVHELETHLLGMKDNDIHALYNTVSRQLTLRNGYVADYNPTLTAALRCHSNALLLGSFEQSKSANHYISPYIKKDKAPLIDSLNIILEAMDHVHKYPSRAEDKHTTSRKVQYMLTRIANKLGSLMEIGDTQAAACLLGMNVILSSELFAVCDVQAAMNLIRNEQTAKLMMEHNGNEVTHDGENKDDTSNSHSAHSILPAVNSVRSTWGNPLYLPQKLPKSDCGEEDVEGDGNCFYHCMNILLYDTTSVDMCFDLRVQLNQHILVHINDNMDDFIPSTVSEMMQNELNEMSVQNCTSALNNTQIETYMTLMSNATPGQATYCSYLVMCAFAHMTQTNLVIYEQDHGDANAYQQIMMKVASPNSETYCLYYVNNCHYRILHHLEEQVNNDYVSEESDNNNNNDNDGYDSDDSWLVNDEDCASNDNNLFLAKESTLKDLLQDDEDLRDACPTNATFQNIQKILQKDLSANLDEPEWKF